MPPYLKLRVPKNKGNLVTYRGISLGTDKKALHISIRLSQDILKNINYPFSESENISNKNNNTANDNTRHDTHDKASKASMVGDVDIVNDKLDVEFDTSGTLARNNTWIATNNGDKNDFIMSQEKVPIEVIDVSSESESDGQEGVRALRSSSARKLSESSSSSLSSRRTSIKKKSSIIKSPSRRLSSSTNNDDSDLSSLDEELNRALSSGIINTSPIIDKLNLSSSSNIENRTMNSRISPRRSPRRSPGSSTKSNENPNKESNDKSLTVSPRQSLTQTPIRDPKSNDSVSRASSRRNSRRSLSPNSKINETDTEKNSSSKSNTSHTKHIISETDLPILPRQILPPAKPSGLRTRVQLAGTRLNHTSLEFPTQNLQSTPETQSSLNTTSEPKSDTQTQHLPQLQLEYQSKDKTKEYKPRKGSQSKENPDDHKDFRNIPQQYLSLMKRELSLFTDVNNEDELSMIQKVIFSLKDPYSGTKINLPIKSTSCKHFECFDFENFCQINKSKISFTDQIKLKKDLCTKNFEARKLEKLYQEQQKALGHGKFLQRIKIPNKSGSAPIYTYPQYSEHGQIFHFALYNKTPPLFQCVICDQLFGIKQLYISDVFNYFVKITPKTVEKIELLDMERYRIIDSTLQNSNAFLGPSKREDVVVLSDSEDESKQSRKSQRHKKGSKKSNDDSESDKGLGADSDEIFDDGLDDILITLGSNDQRKKKGDGSWNNPLTLE